MTENQNARLDALHAHYVSAVNNAVAADDLVLAQELAEAYDRDVRDFGLQAA